MPLNIIGTAIFDGTDSIPYYETIKKNLPYLLATSLVKWWSRGASNTWERKLHGKVYIVTGATSRSMGSNVLLQMAQAGAQLIILARDTDQWTIDWVDSIREQTGNELIYLEDCDLSDLLSVRKFATSWLDNSPPRRLDGVVIMSGDMEPWGIPFVTSPVRKFSKDGLELQVAVNYAGVFHLLNLLQPSFKAQPPDRDVRIIVTTCWLQVFGDINVKDPLWQEVPYKRAWKFFASSKIQLGLCMMELQRRMITDIETKAKEKNVDRSGKNIKVVMVQPGTMRSPSLRRIISNGSIFMLLVLYCIILYPFLWLFTKSGFRGSQSIIYALNTPELEATNLKNADTKYVTDCSIIDFPRKEFKDLDLQKQLFDDTERDILALEKKMAQNRNQKKSTTKSKATKKNKASKKA